MSVHCASSYSLAFSNGQLWAAFSQQQHVYVSLSNDQGRTFNKPQQLSISKEVVFGRGENRPKIVIDYPHIYVSWTRKTKGRFNGDIRFSASHNQGKYFSSPITVNDDGLLTSHRFDALAVSSAGDIYVSWLDKRDKIAASTSGEDYKGAAAYYGVSRDNGRSFINYKLQDNSCECCRMAIGANKINAVAIMWRHIFDNNIRDHSSAIVQGANISNIQRSSFENWSLQGCPHHGPQLDIDSNNNIHAVWFSGAMQKRGLFYARYNEKLNMLGQATSIDNSASSGHPDVITNGGKTIIAWTKLDQGMTRLLVQRSIDNGSSWSKKSVVASSDGPPSYGQLIIINTTTYVSWIHENTGLTLYALEDN